MPTLTETLQALFAVQQIDTQIERAKRAQAALDTGAQAVALADAARTTAQSRRVELNKLSGDLKDSELKLETLETKRKNNQAKLYQGSITNAKELASIEREIESLGRQRGDLDGRILELMEQVEQARTALTVSEAEAARADGHRAEVQASYRARREALDLELTELAARREGAVAAVPDAALLRRYDGLRAKLAGVGLARLDGSTCGGCHMTLPSTLIKAVKEDAQVQVCDNCGRLLMV